MSQALVIVDGTAVLHRTFHAAPADTAPDGRPIAAVRGLLQILTRYVRKASARHFAVVYDAAGPTFRSERFATYKAGRPPHPEG